MSLSKGFVFIAANVLVEMTNPLTEWTGESQWDGDVYTDER